MREVDGKEKEVVCKMYTKLVIHYKGRDIEFQAHEIVLLAQNIIQSYALPYDIEAQVSIPTFDQWFRFLRQMDSTISMENIIAGALDPYITIPLHIQNIDSLPKWLYMTQILNRKYLEDRDMILGTWINISGHLVLVKNTEEMTYYVSDHGNIGKIVTTVSDLAFGQFDWANPELMLILVKVLKKLEKMNAEERKKFETELIESIEADSIEDIRPRYPEDWTDEEILGSVQTMTSNPVKLFLHMDESNRYIIQVLLKKYMRMKFVDNPSFDNEILINFHVYSEDGNLITDTINVNGVEKTWQERLADARRYIKTIVLEHVAVDVNKGVQEQLFRPVYTFGGREKGPTYHEFRDAVTAYMDLPLRLSEAEIAAGMRRMLSGEILNYDEYPSFLPSLVGAWFLAEPTRNPSSFLSGLILLDMMENHIVLQDSEGHNWYSLPNTLVHPLKDSGVGSVIDLYGSDTKGIDRFGGMHPMAHGGSVNQGNAEIKDRHKLTTVRQKEASLLFHWLSIRLESIGVECRLVTDTEELLDQADVVGADEFRTLETEIASVRKKIGKIQTTIKIKENQGKSTAKQKGKLENLKTQENELLDSMVRAELKYDLIKPLLVARLSTFDNLLEGQKSTSKKYVKISPHLEADELGTLMRLKIRESYPDQEVVEILPIDLDGNCMYNAIRHGLLRLPASYVITLEELRTRVAGTIINAEDEVREDYLARLNTQLLTAVIDGDVAGFNTELRTGIANISLQYFELVKQGTDRDIVQQAISQIIREEGLVDAYLKMIRENTAWGGNVELGIMADMLGVQVIVHRRDGQVIPINQQEGLPIIHLDYDGGHYNLILNYPNIIIPSPETNVNITTNRDEEVESLELEYNSILAGLSIIAEEMGSVNFF